MKKQQGNYIDYHLRINSRSIKETTVVKTLKNFNGTMSTLIINALYEYINNHTDEFFENTADDISVNLEVQKQRPTSSSNAQKNIPKPTDCNSKVENETSIIDDSQNIYVENNFEENKLNDDIAGMLDGLKLFG